ncbi:MAG TPA: response regulator transcription factor [Candidatus Dojkabacteria bacterium]|jgi:DNA-binding response OmpR family regulator|nr:response regulator transcription factor [Candidatus Dojkabacteria bacterium]HQC39314.1 response regulator transcription factor [Candidatus Dojkabacteria bacterium]
MNILIIENSSTLSQIMEKTLDSYGYKVTLDNENFGSKVYVKDGIFEFVILNTKLSGNKSEEILSYIIKHCPKTKVLGVCNNGGWPEKVNFLNHGGDDVLTYPFPMQELLARIQSVSRRPKSYVDSSLYLGDLILDTNSKSIQKGNEDIEVRNKEYDLFEYLVRNKDRPISRCELLDHVWDYREYIGSNTIDVHINRLRKKLEDNNIIETVHGIGYVVRDRKPKAS